MLQKKTIIIIAGAAVLSAAVGAFVLMQPRSAVDQDWYRRFAEDTKSKGDAVRPGFRMWVMASDEYNSAYGRFECQAHLMMMNNTYGVINVLAGMATFENALFGRKLAPYRFELVKPKEVVATKLVYDRPCKEIEAIRIASANACAVNNEAVEGCSAILSTMDEMTTGLSGEAKLMVGF